ncbi:MAG: ATP-binding protein [Pseudomonadota bacterium]
MKMKNINSLAVLIISCLLILLSIYFFRSAKSMISEPFPGFLTFENKIVGAFNQFNWTGYDAGLTYHDHINKIGEDRYIITSGDKVRFATIAPMTFTISDFLKTFFLSFSTGILFLISGCVIYFLFRGMQGALPFTLFYLGISFYMISSFDLHTRYTASWLFMAVFTLIPAFMTHFALVYPTLPRQFEKKRWIVALPYLLSAMIYIPYCVSFYFYPTSWPTFEILAVIYAVLSYLFWLLMLGWRMNNADRAFANITAKYLLIGQLLAFMVPLTVMIAIFLFRMKMPLNLVAPVTILLPIASLFGLVLGNLKKTQLQLVQSEKMASLGQLVAGVAHEINNPTTFIYSNIEPLKNYTAYLETIVPFDAPKYKDEMASHEVIADLKSMISNIEEGAIRTKEIVADLRHFAHSTDDVVADVDLVEGIESTIHLLKHETNERISVHKEFRNLPKISANAGQINQVWMNILKNSIDAIDGEGDIWIKTSAEEGNVCVEIKDSGRGIPENILPKIFDPFFTTKDQGEGIGLGLSISHQIVSKHGGKIDVSSKIGEGTTFRVSLAIPSA